MPKNKKPEELDLISRVSSYCATWDLLQKNTTIIIGLSGGPDSVFLLHVLSQLKTEYSLTLVAVHLDHGWRENSAADIDFCKSYATRYDVLFEHAHARDITITKKSSGSLEEQGRLLRRTFFEQVAQKYASPHNPTAIALAHHHDDQIETFFIRLLRGAGVTGLAGIRPQYKNHHKNYIRPLLCCTKEEILTFLHAQALSYLEDPTNKDPRFLRNRIRSTIIPALRTCDTRFDASLERTMAHLQEADEFIQTTTHKTLEKVSIVQKNSQRQLLLPAFAELHPFLQKQILLAWLIESGFPFTVSSGLLDELIRFLLISKNKKHLLYHSWSIIKQNSCATLEGEGAEKANGQKRSGSTTTRNS
ncbi:MAG: tRNA(Ile)-lysidine synthase [candidate division TM6 bacterium GW2011_GWE2_42_60]|nr:MAG: tRNA(Ile)-lysidine synthase [candidate division TM6 bacterium GW2011_GWE2_42_60]